MIDLLPEPGISLVTGASGTGKTRLTARALREWVDEHGPDGVVVLDFAPEYEREGTVLGGRLDRFGPLPDGVWVGEIDARAPRAEARDDAEAVELARENVERATTVLESAPPNPTAVFVNDVTIALQHERAEFEALAAYLEGAEAVVCNAFDDDALGTDDPVSKQERRALERLREIADRELRLAAE